MRLVALTAESDLVGRRINVGFDLYPGEGETLADAPAVRVRRKTRDFEFPPGREGDPHLLYDTAAFPPAGAEVAEIDLGVRLEDAQRILTVADSAWREIGGQRVEVLRRTTATRFDALGRAVHRRVTLLDSGGGPGLAAGETYYYELTSVALSEPARAVATAGELFGHGRALYALMPELHRTHDVTLAAPPQGAEAVPEAAGRGGQLQRFVDLFGFGLDTLRSTADGLTTLHDVDRVDHRRLPWLARWIGWDLSAVAPVPIQRHEIRYAAQLYRITGTVPGCMVWVKRLTDWDSRIAELWRNVLVSNDLGNPSDPADRGSRSLDCSDPELLASRATAADRIDYSYETGPGARYAFDAIGVFATPPATDTAVDVARKRGRLLSNVGLFLPLNLRLVLELDVPVVADTRTAIVGLQRAIDDEED